MSVSEAIRTCACAAIVAASGCVVELGEEPPAGEHDEALTTHRGTVAWTGGDGVNVRAEPTPTSPVVDWIPEGGRIRIACQSRGESVMGNPYWDYLPSRSGYIADAFANTGYASVIPGVPACDGGGGGPTDSSEIRVRGVLLTGNPARAIRRIATEVVDELPGTRAERLDKAAYVTWWALKEGVLDLDNPFVYSNCNFPPDRHIGALEICPDPGRAWQVGVAAVQVSWRTAWSVEEVARTVHPELSANEVLARAGTVSGHAPGTPTGDGIARASGRLRTSWLLRDPAVGFQAQYPTVHGECFVTCRWGGELACSWCFGSGWDRSAQFAPSQSAARAAVADLRAVLDRLSSGAE